MDWATNRLKQQQPAMKTGSSLCAVFFLTAWVIRPETAVSQDGASAESHLELLKSPNPRVRIESLRALQTSLDPRIPDAVLPLLADEGESIRRLAARAIGSRWWQIPEERRSPFIHELRFELKPGNQGVHVIGWDVGEGRIRLISRLPVSSSK